MMYNKSEVKDMQHYENDHSVVSEALWARTMGQEILKFVKSRGVDVDQRIHDEAVAQLEQVKAILDDDSLADPACFHRIDAIVDAFQSAGISTARHDW